MQAISYCVGGSKSILPKSIHANSPTSRRQVYVFRRALKRNGNETQRQFYVYMFGKWWEHNKLQLPLC